MPCKSWINVPDVPLVSDNNGMIGDKDGIACGFHKQVQEDGNPWDN